MWLTVLQIAKINRKWVFRLMSIVLAILPFVVLEICLILFDVGARTSSEDPFVGFANVVPLFESDKTGDFYVISPSRRKFFAPEQFPVEKTPKTFRVFCLGGSTVQGRPYSIETSFTNWLKIALEAADSDKEWEIVNCGGISYASYRLIPIMEECLQYQPDLFILCTGHNEFLEDRSYEGIKRVPDWVARSTHILTSTRTVRFASTVFQSSSGNKTILETDADAMLDYKDGIKAFHRDPAWSKAVVQHFEFNVQRMVSLAKSQGVPILLLKPPSNLSGTFPFKSESDSLTDRQKKELQTLKKTARDLYGADISKAILHWEKICQIDEKNAANWYELGTCFEVQQRFTEAKNAYLRARDLDVCPIRMTTDLAISLEKIAANEGVPFIDLHDFLENKTASGILGDRWLVDHVHPNFEGHQQIALELARWFELRGLVESTESWEDDSQHNFNQYFETLPRSYFHNGQRMLSALQKWTKGDADGKPVEERFPHRIRNE